MAERSKLNSVDKYYIKVFNLMFRIIPPVAALAAVVFTFIKLSGNMQNIAVWHIVVFDVICAGYFVVAQYHIHKGFVVDGKIDQGLLRRARKIYIICLLVQWNLITYTFPARELWATAAFYMLFSALLLNSKTVLQFLIALILSIGVSFVVIGDTLLPAHDEAFVINLSLRAVTLVVCAAFTYILTCCVERLLALAEQNAKALEKRNRELETMSRDIIVFTADLIEQRDSTSGTHVKRVKEYTKIIATEVAAQCPEYKLTPENIDAIAQASVLHDVGKIQISDSILLKPGKLTPEEFDEIKKHTTYGANVVDMLPDSVDETFRKYGREIAVGHHEKYDGKGYPKGLSGDDIPISAQIVSVADCFDALTTDRPYKKAFTPETAFKMIRTGQCGTFSEKLLNCLKQCENKFETVCEQKDSSDTI